MGLLNQLRHIFSASKEIPLRMGLVGAGVAMERIHVPTLTKLGGKFHLWGVCSSTPEHARQFATEHGIERSYENVDELLRDPNIDVVVVAVPLHLNALMAEKVLQAKKHLLIEKPLAPSLEEAQRMAAVAKQSGTIAMVAENILYWPVIEAVKTQLDGEIIGKPTLVLWNSVQHVSASTLPPWRTQPTYAHGYLIESGIHLIAGLRYLFGPLAIVQAHNETLYPELGNGDFMTITLAGEKNLRVVLTFLRTPLEHSVNDNRCTIVGSEGKIIFSSNRYLIRALDADRDVEMSGDLGYQREYEDLYKSIRERRPPLSSFERACEDIELLWKALKHEC